MQNAKIAVLGAGNMGTAIAQVIARNGNQVALWNHESDPEPLDQIAQFHENKKYCAGIKLSPNIIPQKDLAAALGPARVIFFVVPSNFMAATTTRVAAFIQKNVICVDVSKGLDEKTLALIPDIIKKNCHTKKVATISGPAIANDMARGQFTAMNLACKDQAAAKQVKKIMESANLKLIATDDLAGVEVTGSFKNVYAIAMGLCDGLKMAMNTKAALLVVALKEVGLLIKKMGGKAETVYDLAGLGDMVGTGLCDISRNRRFGEFLAQGNSPDEAVKKVGQVVEGKNACGVLCRLAKKYKLKMPFAAMINDVASGKAAPKIAMRKFLNSYGKV